MPAKRDVVQARLEKFRSWSKYVDGEWFTAYEVQDLCGVTMKDAHYIIRNHTKFLTRVKSGNTAKYRRTTAPKLNIVTSAWRTKTDEELGINGEEDMLEPMARESDPQTSHDAAERHTVLGKRAERSRQVLALIATHPGSTTGELSRYMFDKHPDLPMRTCAESPHKRAGELERHDLASRGEKRECLDSGYVCETWYITDRGRRELGLQVCGDEYLQQGMFG